MIIVMLFLYVLTYLGLAALTLSLTKNIGLKKVGYGLATLITLAFLYLPLSYNLDKYFFSKNDAKEVLKENYIELTDDFEFVEKDIAGIMDYILEFKISISKSDKEAIIKSIQSSEYWVENSGFYIIDLYSKVPKPLERDTILFVAYEIENFWNIQRLVYRTNNYVSTDDIIQISKSENSLKLLRNE